MAIFPRIGPIFSPSTIVFSRNASRGKKRHSSIDNVCVAWVGSSIFQTEYITFPGNQDLAVAEAASPAVLGAWCNGQDFGGGKERFRVNWDVYSKFHLARSRITRIITYITRLIFSGPFGQNYLLRITRIIAYTRIFFSGSFGQNIHDLLRITQIIAEIE